MKITIETVPHDQQVYPTVGDWRLADGVLAIRVSKMGNWRYEAAVATHELLEALLCMDAAIGAAEVDAFDMTYTGDGEPGDDPAAPYHRQHCFATAVERMLIAAMGLPWGEYDAAVEALP
jgi:hypothetical protein